MRWENLTRVLMKYSYLEISTQNVSADGILRKTNSEKQQKDTKNCFVSNSLKERINMDILEGVLVIEIFQLIALVAILTITAVRRDREK